MRRSNLIVSVYVQFSEFCSVQSVMVISVLIFCEDYGFFHADNVLFTSGLLLTQFFPTMHQQKCQAEAEEARKPIQKLLSQNPTLWNLHKFQVRNRKRGPNNKIVIMYSFPYKLAQTM